MIALEEAKEWIRIDADYDGEDSIINNLIEESIFEIKNATGVPPDYDSKLKNEENIREVTALYNRAQRLLIADMYNEKETENKALIGTYIKLESAYSRLIRKESEEVISNG